MRPFLALALAIAAAAAFGCAPAPVGSEVKIALVAPFEGRQRSVGYEVFPGLREAIREHAGAGATVTFVAYNDSGDPDAAERAARAVVRDPDVVAVIGHFAAETSSRAARVYADAGLAFIAFSSADGPAPLFAAGFGATERLLRAVDMVTARGEQPTRAAVARALAQVDSRP